MASSNHLRFSQSNKTLRFSKKISSLRQDASKSLSMVPENTRSSMPIVQSHHMRWDGGKSINLPPVEVKQTSAKNCSAVDILQLANSFTHDLGCQKGSSETSSNFKGPSRLPVSIISRKSRGSFQTSTSSEPSLKSRKPMKTIPRRQSVIPPANTRHSLNENVNHFAKSWPSVLENQIATTVTVLPKLESNKSSNSLLKYEMQRRESSNNLKGGLAKFNQSTSFRLNRRQPSTDFKNSLENVRTKKKSSVKSTPPSSLNQQDQKQDQTIVIETFTDLISGVTKKIQNMTTDKKRHSVDSEDSEFTQVTAESVRVHPDCDVTEEAEYDGDLEQDELDKRCVKWLQDVERERTQNPDKIFLPHLLML